MSEPAPDWNTLRSWSRDEVRAHQQARWDQLRRDVLPANAFYSKRLAESPQSTALDDLPHWPATTKAEVMGDPPGTVAANLTHPRERYLRFHRTSGTKGRPLTVLDTAEDWAWWINAWQLVLDSAEVTPEDRALLAFSFGPFIGFWSAHDALAARGAMVIPSGGMGTEARLELLAATEATVVCCTPTYALRMAEVATAVGMKLTDLPVRRIIVAGEPGGSVPATRERIEQAWGAKLIDHAGASEVGPWGFSDREQHGLYVNELHFLAEFRAVDSGELARPGELSELYLTTLGRHGCPVIRYRTGDLVRPVWDHGGELPLVLLEGGVLARADDMLIIRGVNIFPSSLEEILRGFPEVAEFRITAFRRGTMDALRVEVEDALKRPERIARELHLRLGLHVDVVVVEAESLPRFEGKSRRFVDARDS